MGQVLGYGWRAAASWAVVFAAAFVARDVFDWRVPDNRFPHARDCDNLGRSRNFSACRISGRVAVGIRESGSYRRPCGRWPRRPASASRSAVLLSLWHDPATLSAIRDSGGLGEVFTMPFLTVVPCVLISALGGILGARASYFANWLTNR